jgi:hypothetical protein
MGVSRITNSRETGAAERVGSAKSGLACRMLRKQEKVITWG